MKLFKLSALGAAVLAATSVTAHADFINDSSFDIKLRNVYFDKDYENSADDWKQWAQGIEANFKSGYIGDVIGFDASYYGALKLDHGGADTKGQLLGGDKGDHGYSKLGQAYLKAKLGDDNLGFYGQAGLMTMDQGLIASSGSRTTPSSFRGAHGKVSINDFDVYSSYVDRISERAATGYDKLVNHDGKEIDNAYQFGGAYKANNISAELAYLEAKDYQKQYLADLGYTLQLNEEMSLFFGGIYQEAKKGGDLWNPSHADQGFDDKAKHYNLNTKLSIGDLALTLSYAKTDAEKANGLGYLEYMFAANDYGRTPSLVSRQISDFMYNGEKVWQLGAEYGFDNLGAPGLKTSLTYTKGTDVDGKKDGKTYDGENETDLEVSYAFQQEQLKGLSVKMQHGWHTAKFSSNHKDESTKDLRVYVDYTVSVF